MISHPHMRYISSSRWEIKNLLCAPNLFCVAGTEQVSREKAEQSEGLNGTDLSPSILSDWSG